MQAVVLGEGGAQARARRPSANLSDLGSVAPVTAPVCSAPTSSFAPLPLEHGAPSGSAPRRMLLIDDELTICRALTLALRTEYDVVSFTSARDALRCLEQDRGFDVILCDLTMPDLSGRDVYEALHRQAPHQATRLVFMSGVSPGSRAAAFLRGTPYAFLEKPFDMRQLRQAIARQGGGASSTRPHESAP